MIVTGAGSEGIVLISQQISIRSGEAILFFILFTAECGHPSSWIDYGCPRKTWVSTKNMGVHEKHGCPKFFQWIAQDCI
jgi:hypothetical protein